MFFIFTKWQNCSSYYCSEYFVHPDTLRKSRYRFLQIHDVYNKIAKWCSSCKSYSKSYDPAYTDISLLFFHRRRAIIAASGLREFNYSLRLKPLIDDLYKENSFKQHLESWRSQRVLRYAVLHLHCNLLKYLFFFLLPVGWKETYSRRKIIVIIVTILHLGVPAILSTPFSPLSLSLCAPIFLRKRYFRDC